MSDTPLNENPIDNFVSKSQLANFLQYWQQLLEEERRKSPELPILWGHKAYSQHDEDGILQEILRRVGITSRTFLEIGVGNGVENNTLFWLKQQWQGAWIEGAHENVAFIRQAFAPATETGRLHVTHAMVSAKNVDALISSTPLAGREIDLLSIDIDGNDYYVFEQLQIIRPRVVVIEYNAKFPPPARWRIPYSPDFVWDGSDWFGASLESMNALFERRGYSLVSCNITGSNAFFVRKDLLNGHFPCIGDMRALYQPPRYYLTFGLFSRIAVMRPVSPRLDCICD